MNKYSIALTIFLLLFCLGCDRHKTTNVNYINNPEPLLKNCYIKLPLGSVKPYGWLKSQLEAQISGIIINGYSVWSDRSSWQSGTTNRYVAGTNYLNGLVPVAYLLNNDSLKSKVKQSVEILLTENSDKEWPNKPGKINDQWPFMVTCKVFMQYYEATGDKRVIDIMTKYFRYLHDNPAGISENKKSSTMAMENAVAGYWLYRQTSEPWILETIESIEKNSFDWTSYYEKFPWDSVALTGKKIPINNNSDGLTALAVNNAKSIKYPGLWYQQSKDDKFKKAVFSGIEKLDKFHGQIGGRFSGDDYLSGKNPLHGTELCSVAEYMFSLEELYGILGTNSIADKLELLTYNSLPGTSTPDLQKYQRYQQSNQVILSSSKNERSNGNDISNIYVVPPDSDLCRSDIQQAWPYFIENMWMATNDNGLAVVSYGPSVVYAKVANGADVNITEETDYPFNENIKFTITTNKPVKFPVEFRIPGWADSLIVSYKGKSVVARGEKYRLMSKWKNGDQVTLKIPMNLRMENRFNNSVSLLRGPLYFSLRIEKDFRKIKSDNNINDQSKIDWEIYPKSSWNYGLLIDPINTMRGMKIFENRAGKYPFSDKGDMVWSSELGKYIEITDDAPVVIRARGIRIPNWTIVNNCAGITPVSPVIPEEDPEIINLIPYGCARLRITEFPVMDIVMMEDIIK
jgi:uncharacterized protein